MFIHKPDEVLIYYDRPLLFTLKSEESDNGEEVWICSPITEEKLSDVKSGAVDLREGFLGRPYSVVRVMANGDPVITIAAEVSDEWLPDVGAKLRV